MMKQLLLNQWKQSGRGFALLGLLLATAMTLLPQRAWAQKQDLILRFGTGDSYFDNNSTEYVDFDSKDNYLMPELKKIEDNQASTDLTGLSITYSSTDPTVATVSETGKISIVGGGCTTIRAVSAENETYNSAEAYFKLNVRPSDPSVSLEHGIYFVGAKVTLIKSVPNGTMYYQIGANGEKVEYVEGTEIELPKGQCEFYAYTKCSNDEGSVESYGNNHKTFYVYDKPTITPVGGTYDEAQEVEITNLPETGTVYYITDGTEINYANDGETSDYDPEGLPYTSGAKITIGESKTLKVYIYLEGDSAKKYKSEAVEAKYIIRQNPNLRYTDATTTSHEVVVTEATASYGLPFNQPELKNLLEVPVFYSSSDTGVATIDEEGFVEITGRGQTTITATSTASEDDYLPSTASYTLTVEAGDMSDMAVISFKVEDEEYAEVYSATYTGTEIKPGVVVWGNDVALAEGTDYEVTYSNNINAATPNDQNPPTVTVTFKGNYKGSASGTFTIEPADLSNVTIEKIADQTYTGSAIEPAVTVKLDDVTIDAEQYMVEYSNNVNVGEATVTVNFTSSNFMTQETAKIKETTFQIVSATAIITAEVTQTVTYDAEAHEIAATVDKGEIAITYYNSEDEREKGSNALETAPVNAGTYYTRVSQTASNYTSEPVDVTFTIGQKTLTEAMVKLSDESFEYNGETQKPEVTVSDKIMVKEVETEIITANDYTITNEGGSAVGTYTVTVTGKGNYTGEVTKTFEISRRTVSADELGVSGEGNYGSYYHATEDLSLPEGYSAYIVSGITDAAATLTAISYIPKATPVIVSQSSDSGEATDAATDGNMMLHADGDVTVASINGTVYGLYNNVLMRVSRTIPAGKNYLVVTGVAGAPKLTFVVDKGQGEGSATAIGTIETSETDHDAWYTLDGRRLQQKPSQKGIYIRNGQKVVVNK